MLFRRKMFSYIILIQFTTSKKAKKPPAIAGGFNINYLENQTNLPGLICYQLLLRDL
jgi:hypothetical protein